METAVRYFAHVQNKLNVDGGDEHNHAMFEKYYGYWK